MLDHEIFDDSVSADEQWDAEPEKRNCGHTGPTSPEGRASSSQNAIKHGACSRTLVLPCESEESWQLLLRHWTDIYQPVEDSLEYDFVLKTAQAEWHRIRNQRYFDSFISTTQGFSPFNWTPDQIKKHDLILRYKTSAERAFQREYRLLEQHYKIHRPTAPKERAFGDSPTVIFAKEDPDSPHGYSEFVKCFGGRQVAGTMLAKQAHTGSPETTLAQQAHSDAGEGPGTTSTDAPQPHGIGTGSPETQSTHDPPSIEKT